MSNGYSTLKESLEEAAALPPGGRPFLVLAEIVPLPGHDLSNFEAFLAAYEARRDEIPSGFRLSAVAIPQNPRGVAGLEPADVFSLLARKSRGSPDAPFSSRGLWRDLDVVAHVAAKDRNADALRASLFGLRALGLTSILAVTGDLPASGRRVFDLDSLGLIRLAREVEFEGLHASPVGRLASVPRFEVLAAVSPFKYTEASLIQQYLKLDRKLAAGADGFITQVGWDSRKSEELFRRLAEKRPAPPVFGNVFLLTPAAARLMHAGQMVGCHVSSELYARVRTEKAGEAIERAALQTAMYRDLGAAGADLGGFPDFATLLAVLRRAAEIGTAWRERRGLLDFGPRRLPDGSAPFYLYDEDRGSVPRPRRPTFHERTFDILHDTVLTKGRGLNPLFKGVCGLSPSLRRGAGVPATLFHAAETAVKSVLFDCEDCGDCFLPENFGYCTLGRCAKGLPNPPCGDADPAGRCGNDLDRVCVAELIFGAAAAKGRPGLARLAALSNPPRLAALENTSAVLNYLFDRDHAAGSPFLAIAELLHASIPRTAAAMSELLARGPEAFERPSPALDYLAGLIEAQARRGAAFIDVNVDAFGESDLAYRSEVMRNFVRLVRRRSNGVPVCVDSGSPEILQAGLEAWYEGDGPGRPPMPLLNSVKTYTMDRILPLRARFPFKIIGLLVDDKSAGREGGVYGVEELLAMAREIFRAATGRHGFVPGDIFFDSTVFPLSIDMPLDAEKPGYTYRAFETIRRIKADREMRGVHLSLGVSNSVRDLPGRRTGVCRAYLAKAMERGLDAGIVNVFHDYGKRPAAPELLEFVDAFVRQDGSPEAVARAIEAMVGFCRANRRR